MVIHLPCDNEPFCGAALRPGDFLSEVEPVEGGCRVCVLVSMMATREALLRLERAAGVARVKLAALGDEMRRVRGEILQVGVLKWKPE